MERVLQIREPWFTHIKQGRKTIEGRRGRLEDFKDLESILFQCNDETLKVSVITVRHYATLYDMVTYEDWMKLLPGINTKQAALDVYHAFWNDGFIEASGGMVAIDIALHDPNKRFRGA